MSDEREEPDEVASGGTLDPRLAAVLDAHRPVAREEFRAQLRSRFVAGAEEAPAASAPPRPRLLIGTLTGALAAAAVLIVWFVTSGGGPRWTVELEEFVAEGIKVDGEVLPADADPEAFAQLLAGAEDLETGEHPLRLRLAELFVIELDSDTHLDLSGLSADPAQGSLVLAGDRGGYRIATGPAFAPGNHVLEFNTPQCDVRVLGTVFGIDVFDNGLVCVCCFEGTVETRPCGKPAATPELVLKRQTLMASPAGLARKVDFEPHQKPLRELARFWSE